MKQRIIDWLYKDLLMGTFKSVNNVPEYKAILKNIAEEKGTALYLHLFADKGDVDEYYKED